MTIIDKWLQQQRIAQALKYIPHKAFVLDVGCYQGEMFLNNLDKFSGGIGIDPLCENPSTQKNFELIKGNFPDDLPVNKTFDVITALAVIEHIPEGKHAAFFKACSTVLNTNGIVICTIPHKAVDTILQVLLKLKLVKGMSLEQHHGYDIALTESYARISGLFLKKHQRFQLGLNHLFVFQKNTS